MRPRGWMELRALDALPGRWRSVPVSRRVGHGLKQLAGDVDEWTASPFEAHPGFTAFPYREDSEVFFGGDFRVLRGASRANAPSLARATSRNWDHPYRRQVFAGARVAWDPPEPLPPP